VESAGNASDDLERTAALDSAERKLRSAKSNTRSLKMEIRLLANPNERGRYEKELSSYEATIAQLTGEAKSLRQDGSRNQLFLGANSKGSSPDNPHGDGDALLNEAGHLQDKTQQSLSNTKQMIAESKQVGMATAEELQRQREQINNIDGAVMRMEDNLDRADKLIKTFGKRMATDKLIQCFACVNILLIVGVVIYTVVKGGLDKNTDSGAPESPVDGSSGSRMLRGTLGWL